MRLSGVVPTLGYAVRMFFGTNLGILFIILTWLVIIAVAAVALYWSVRLAIRHALRDHTRCERNGEP